MKYILKSDKIKKDINAKLFSDLHYVPGDDLKFLEKSLDNIQLNQPDYVFFLGDLVDDSIYELKQLIDLIELLYEMTKYTKVILVLGNHDQLTKNFTGSWQEYHNNALINTLKHLGIIVLENNSYSDENICVYGTKFSGMYYEEKEPQQLFIDNIQNISFYDSNKFNILLEHSPYYTFNTELMKKLGILTNVDLVLAGHYHNGCIPWYAGKFIPGNFGIVDPYMRVLPKNARGEKHIIEDCYGIISTPVTTFSSNSKVLRKVNKAFIPRNQDIKVIKK